MKVDAVTHRPWLKPDRLFLVFKYAVFILLTTNLFFFWRENALAAPHMYVGGVDWHNVLEAYSDTIDTLAWLILLWLFELETAVIPDEKLRGGLKWLLTAIRAICYIFIITSFFGYIGAWSQVSEVMPFVIEDVCSLVGSSFSWIETLDQYPTLDAASCLALQGESLVHIAGTEIIGTPDAARAIAHLGFVDIVNSAAWLLVVLVLEAEVLLQLRNQVGPRLVTWLKVIKAVLYSTLFATAIYWGFEGDFLDFWDAFLWLVAFVFIELNIFQWQAEIEEEQAHGHQPGYLTDES